MGLSKGGQIFLAHVLAVPESSVSDTSGWLGLGFGGVFLSFTSKGVADRILGVGLL
jgi:hypothetical protein